MYICVENLLDSAGQAHYKGLDIYNIQSGSFIHLAEFNKAYFFYNGQNETNHPDVMEIAEEVYEAAKSAMQQPPENPTLARVKLLEQKNDELIAADLDNKELIVALYDMLMGGE
jgi:hypothetical protein